MLRAALQHAAGGKPAGADGCIVGVPYPWDPTAVEALTTTW